MLPRPNPPTTVNVDRENTTVGTEHQSQHGKGNSDFVSWFSSYSFSFSHVFSHYPANTS
jgi:hypothetical protein